MATDRLGFITALRKQPDDRTLPLIFADWLEEQGEEEQAQFIRLQCQYADLSPDDFSEATRSLREQHQQAIRRKKRLSAVTSTCLKIERGRWNLAFLGVSSTACRFRSSGWSREQRPSPGKLPCSAP